MQVTVFGANGKVGRLVVARLLENDHDVVAFIHSSSSLPVHPNLRLARGDVHEENDIERAISGSQAVISCLSSWHTPDKNILSSAMQRLIPAMSQQGISRVISLTGCGAFAPTDIPTFFDKTHHAVLNMIAPKILRDGEEHIRLLLESSLDWIVVRSPVMNEYGSTKYSLQEKLPSPLQTINRQAVADALVNLLEDSAYSRTAPCIVRA
jgi:putative NADH-flavin reductase